jgi:UDP-GlcNAc:undecaprenyl-phosphate GlcNAc-1-phosphate transferase
MNEFMFYVPLAAFIAVLLLIPLARSFALHIGFVDAPGGRKQHDIPVPPIGGLVIFPVYMLCAFLGGVPMDVYWPLFLGISILLIVGVLDDWLHLHPWVKFTSQIAVAFLVVLWGEARLYELGDLFGFGPLGLGFMSIPFSVAAVALLINAINLMDGLDGLAGGKGFVVLFWLVLASMLAGEMGAVLVIAPMMAALAGFLVYNMRHPLRDKASIFMGDAGSMALGLVLAWFCVGLAQQPDPVLVPISIAWILALPIIDTCGQFYRRAKEGKHPFSPDRGHFHHHFIHAGIPVGQSTLAILALGVVLGGIGYVGIQIGVPQVVLTILWIALLFSHMAMCRQPERYINILKKLFRTDQDTR